MTKKLFILACLVQTIGLSAMEVEAVFEVNADAEVNAAKKVNAYRHIGGNVCTDAEDEQLHNLFTTAATLSAKELEEQYTKLKNEIGVDITAIISQETGNTVFHQLVEQKASVESVAFLINNLGINRGLMLSVLENKQHKTVVQLTEEQNPKNEDLVKLLLSNSEGTRALMDYGSRALDGAFYVVIAGVLFGGYKLYNYCTTDKTAIII